MSESHPNDGPYLVWMCAVSNSLYFSPFAKCILKCYFVCVATEKDRQMMTLIVASADSTCSPFVWHFVQDV